MAQTITLKRSSVAGRAPTTVDLSLGEIAINTFDGVVYIKKNNGTESIVSLREITENTLVIDSSGLSNSSSGTLAGVLSDLDSAITAAGGGTFVTTNTAQTISGQKTFTGGVLANSIQVTGGTGTQGTVTWNSDEETLDLIQNGSTLQLGQEVHYHVRNNTAALIPNGTPVMATGTIGESSRITIAPMDGTNVANSKFFLGFTTTDIAADSDGKVTHFGKIRGINTSAYALGTVLYISTTVVGGVTTTEPVAGMKLPVAFVINSHASVGAIFVRATNGSSMADLHDVNEAGLANGNLLRYESATNQWKPIASTTTNITEGTNLYYTTARANSAIDARVTKTFVDALGVRAATADKLTTARTISLTGDVTGSVSFDGSANASITAVVQDDSHNHIISNIDGLQTALDGKQVTGSYVTTDTAQTITSSKNFSSGVFGAVNINRTNSSNSVIGYSQSQSGSSTYYAGYDAAQGIFGFLASAAAITSSPVRISVPSSAIYSSIYYDRDNTAYYTDPASTSNLLGLTVANTITGSISGNAGTATKLATARTISLAGDVTGSVSFDGSANVSITATVADDSHNHIISNVDGLQAALDGKAPLASPALTGTPTAPTATAGTNTTQIATTAYVQTAVSSLVDSAPGTLDTLNELAAALGDDPNFATTVTNQIATKLDASAYTAADVLAKIKTVDGAGSGLDADLLDGQHASAFASASHTHTIANVTGLQAALDGKASTDLATSTAAGLVQLGSDTVQTVAAVTPTATASRTYAVQKNGSDQLVVNIPWTNTTYALITEAAILAGTETTARTISAARLQYAFNNKKAATSGTADLALSVDWGNISNTPSTFTPSAHTHVISDVTGLQTALDGKAPLASPALTGTPTAPTAAVATNTTQIATTAFVKAQGYTTNTGTVTSVAATAGTGISVTGSPITTSGTLTITNTAPNVTTNISTTHAASSVTVNSSDGTNGVINAATTTLAGVMTGADKTKLDGIAAGAQVNVATNLSLGTLTTTTVPVNSSTGTNVTLPAATTTLAGVMTSTDKTKLDGIAAGAQVNVATNLGYTTAASNGTVTSSTGTNATLPAATTSLAGLMTGADKTKLDGIAAGAQVNVATNLGITAGTTAGPIVTSSTGTNATLPTATASASGVVTTGNQTFAGVKTFNSTITGSISGNAGTATTLQTARTINGTSFNGSGNIETTEWIHSSRDFPNGTLITTNINYAVTNGDPFVLEIRGNSYANIVPVDLIYQGYIYQDTIINHGGISNGFNISGLVAINNGGNLCFWFPSQGYWQGYNVKVYSALATRAVNRVTSITNVAKPTTAKEVALSANIRQSLHSSNYNSYSPTLTGTGASGTWGISITGNAGTATTATTATTANNATNLGGLSSTYYDHRAYTSASNYLGGHYTSGGAEKPNSSTFGAGKLKLAMLSASNLGFGGSWNDVLWLSGYTGGDVKGSYAIVCNKYSDDIWFSRQNFDSASWGTGRRLLHSGNYNSYSPTLTGTGASGTWGISITGSSASTTGNAATATTLQTARTINGVSFNGSANITIADSTKLPLVGGTLTGALTGTRTSMTGTGNDYHTGGFETRGNGTTNTVFPTIGFHQPGLYASSIQLRAGADFRFYAQGGSTLANVTAGTFNGALSGNATTATTLQTTRAINGTNFNGSAAITTANWGTARTITVGATGKSVNGSGNISWSLAEIGAAPASHTHTLGYFSSSLASDLDTLYGTGQFGFASTTVGRPESFGQGINIVSSGTAHNNSNNWITQLAFGTGGTTAYFRGKTNTGGWQPWRTILHNNNYNSYSPTLTGTGASGTWGINITGNSATTSQRTFSGDLVGSSSVRGPIFYDTNNTAYYVDPASTTTSIQVAGAIEQGNNFSHPEIEWSSTSATGMVIFYLPGTTSNYGMVHMVFDMYEYVTGKTATVIIGGHNWTAPAWFNNGCQVVGWTDKTVRLGVKNGRYCVIFGGVGSSWSYGTIRLRKIHNASFYNNIMDLGGNWSTELTNAESFTAVSGDLRQLRTSNTFTADGDVRSPIFYDSNNTAYYVDPSSISEFWRINASDYIYTASDVYGKRFIDVDNQAYYVDPASTSVMNVVRANNGNAAGFKIGASGPNLTAAAGSNEFVIQGATQVRFGNSAWDYNAWAGLRYDGSTNPIYIGGPASGAFASNASPPVPPLIFTGVSYSESEGSLRAPIFYDSNDTTYYVDPASTSQTAGRMRGGTLHGPNTNWGDYLLVGGNGREGYINNTTVASVCTTDGNLHLDAASAHITYINYYDGTNVYFGNGNNGIVITFDSSGNGVFNGNVTAYSDIKLKDNIETIPDAINKVKQVRGVTYTRKDLEDKQKRYSGVIAQEVEAVLPEVVGTNEEGTKHVAYGNMVGLLIEAIKEQQTQIEELTSQINTLKEMIK